MEGWILLYRKLSDNKFWTCEKFSRGQAWVDLLLLANHCDSFFYVRGNKVNVKKGQLAWGEVKLSLRWKWSRSKLRKFLNDLEKEHQIEQQKSNVIQIITIINYDLYQKKGQQGEQQKDNRKTAEEQQKDIYKECITMLKNENNVKEIDEWDNVFNIWLNYKSEKKEYYVKSGMDKMIKKLIKYAKGDYKVGLQIIENSMANNWAGLFELKDNGKKINDYGTEGMFK